MDVSDFTTGKDIDWSEVRGKIGSAWPGFKATAAGLFVFTGQRLAFGIVVLVFIIFLSYLGVNMATGTEFYPALQDAFPRTAAYLQDVLQGDLGVTTTGSETLLPRPVIDVIRERLPRSLGLIGAALLFASVIGISLGIIAANSRSQSSLGILVLTIVGVSIPSFLAAFLLQWAAITMTQKFGKTILPVGGFGWDKRIILPMLVLAARPIAQITRMTFVSIREVLGQDYVRTADSKGMRHSRVMTVHVLRNAAIPILTTIGVSLGFCLSSLPVVELYFGWPGVGVTLLKSIAQQDIYLVIALTLCLGMVFILVNVVLEASYRLIDPRVRVKPDHISGRDRQTILEAIRSAWSGFTDFLADNALTNFIRGRKQEPQDKPFYDLDQLESVQVNHHAEDSYRMRGAWRAVFRNFPLVVGGLMVFGFLVIILFGPMLAPNNPFQTQGLVKINGQLTPPPFAPNETYPWGTDALGRDLMSLLLSGAQQTLTLALIAVAARLLLGSVLGAIAGWTNGSLVDRAIVGLAEIIAPFPTLLLTMMLILAIGIRQGMSTFVIALCLVGWGEIMYFVRSEVISIRPKPFIESAVATGRRSIGIVIYHIMPNLFSALVSIAALEMGAVLMLLGELGFISIFIGGGSLIALPSQTILYSDVPEWGALLSNIRYMVRSYPWVGFYPMMAFFVAILSFNLFGEGIRRMVDEGNPLLNRLINRNTVLVVLVGVLGYNWLTSNSGSMPFFRQQAQEFLGENALLHTAILAHPEMQGRALGTPGMDRAAEYIAGLFEKMGLQPGGEQRTFYQVRKRSFERLLEEPYFAIEDADSSLEYRQDFAAYPGLNLTLGEANSPVRYMAMGERIDPSTGGWYLHYPELDRADYTGEILLTLTDYEARLLTNVPKDGLLVVTDDSDKLEKRYTLSARSGQYLNFFGNSRGEEDPYIWISEQTADMLLASSGVNVAQLRDQKSELAVEAVYKLPLETKAAMSVEGVIEEKWPVKNVIGLWPGTVSFDNCYDCPANKLIVVMAQYDSPPVGPEGVYQAANDNASGVAVMLETIRAMKETGYQPYKSFLFVAYSREGLDGGEPVNEEDVSKILQAYPSFSNFTVETIVILRGLGAGSGERLEVSAKGSLRFAELFDMAAKQMGVRTVRSDDPIDIGVIYDQGNAVLRGGQEAPIVRLYWEGWEETSRLPTDELMSISTSNLEDSGRVLSLSLMVMGREPDK